MKIYLCSDNSQENLKTLFNLNNLTPGYFPFTGRTSQYELTQSEVIQIINNEKLIFVQEDSFDTFIIFLPKQLVDEHSKFNESVLKTHLVISDMNKSEKESVIKFFNKIFNNEIEMKFPSKHNIQGYFSKPDGIYTGKHSFSFSYKPSSKLQEFLVVFNSNARVNAEKIINNVKLNEKDLEK